MSGPDQSATQQNAIIWPELWAAFENHRVKVLEILRSLATTDRTKTLAIWGAGRTTDLDLISLINHYAKIELVDLDGTLTQRALSQRGFDDHPQVSVAESTDLSGLHQSWAEFESDPSEWQLKQIIDRAGNVSLGFEQAYDVVASTCLLSQIIRKAFETLSGSGMAEATIHSLFPALVSAIRKKHIEMLLESTTPGGACVLITDLTSSDSLPEMLEPNADLYQLYSTKVIQGNHFHGLNPRSITDSTQQPEIANQLLDVQRSAPWIWDSLEMKYLCIAFLFRKK